MFLVSRLLAELPKTAFNSLYRLIHQHMIVSNFLNLLSGNTHQERVEFLQHGHMISKENVA